MATTPIDWPLTDRLQHVHHWLTQQGEHEFAAQIVEAQARLVAQQDLQRIQAAAPDLLEACEEAEEAARLAGIHLTPLGGLCPWYATLTAAIAKATT